MRYTSDEINRMSWTEWVETMAKELNSAGYRKMVRDNQTGEWSRIGEYNALEPKMFVMLIDDSSAISYLKSIGLLNNGRCPMCGDRTFNNPGRFTNHRDNNIHFQICQNCATTGIKRKRSSLSSIVIFGSILAVLLYFTDTVFMPNQDWLYYFIITILFSVLGAPNLGENGRATRITGLTTIGIFIFGITRFWRADNWWYILVAFAISLFGILPFATLVDTYFYGRGQEYTRFISRIIAFILIITTFCMVY